MRKEYLPAIPTLIAIILGLAKWRWPEMSSQEMMIIEVAFWSTIGILIATLLFIFWNKIIHCLPFRIVRLSSNRHLVEDNQEYSSEVMSKLDKLIFEGDRLVNCMQMPNFGLYTTENIGESVRKWLDDVERDIWEIIPNRASYVIETRGGLSPEDKLRYQGWNYDEASLRISVDRKLLRLREVRSQIRIKRGK